MNVETLQFYPPKFRNNCVVSGHPVKSVQLLVLPCTGSQQENCVKGEGKKVLWSPVGVEAVGVADSASLPLASTFRFLERG